MKEQLNLFFVSTFDRILALEEETLHRSPFTNLSVREYHVLDVVFEMEKVDRNTMSGIANKLGISIGALTTAMNTLVKKEYVCRSYPKEDRRLVKICLTDMGVRANEVHQLFHRTLIEYVSAAMKEEEIETLATSLKKINDFLKGMENNDTNHNR